MNRKILIMAAVAAERDAIERGLRGNENFEVKLAGVGPVAAAVSTSAALAGASYRLVVSAGIAGGFAGRAAIGSVVVASEIIAADLGVETPDGFSPLDALGFGTSRIGVDGALAARLTAAFAAAGLAAHCGPVLTVSTATGTATTAAALAGRVDGAAAEGMEGYGVAAAAQAFGLPALEIRAVSNAVGPRDRSAWRIGEALTALEAASSILPEVLIS